MPKILEIEPRLMHHTAFHRVTCDARTWSAVCDAAVKGSGMVLNDETVVSPRDSLAFCQAVRKGLAADATATQSGHDSSQFIGVDKRNVLSEPAAKAKLAEILDVMGCDGGVILSWKERHDR